MALSRLLHTTKRMFGGLALLYIMPFLAHAQSFDCRRAANRIEEAICADKELAVLDAQLAADFKALISTEPKKRSALVGEEREWLHERDEQCGQEGEATSLHSCLTAVYLGRMTRIAQEAPDISDPRGSHSSCQRIIERYSPLANRHPGEAPLNVLANTPGSGLKLTEQTVGDTVAVADFPAWAAAQKPPFVISEVLLKVLKEYEDTGGPGALARVPGTDFYSFTRADGSEHCSDSQSFRVLGGFAFPWATPAEPGGEGSCDIGAEYATLDGNALAIVQDYNWRPGMTASLDVWRWTGRDFSHECQVSLTYKPRFTKETLNDWGETCEGSACEALRRAAFKLAAATDADPTALKDGSLDPLAPAQREEFKAMAETFESQARDPSSNDAFSIPFFNNGHLYLASIGHYAIGWRDYADYSVLFEELKDGKLLPRGAFSVGTWKGDLESIAASGP
jgi:uncharacterized protein